MTHHSLRPFSFSLLSSATSSKTEYFETYDFISKLSSSLPLPKPAATTDETMVEYMSGWVAKAAADKGASFAWKVMEKQIYTFDTSYQQNRFMIKKHIIEEWIMSAMTTEEIVAVNLTNSANFTTSKKHRLCGREGKAGERKQGREHGGLEVMVYNRNGWGYLFYLTQWDASKAFVLKGGSHKEFYHHSYFATGDQVEMWAFRNRDGKLCFIIGNKIDLEISL